MQKNKENGMPAEYSPKVERKEDKNYLKFKEEETYRVRFLSKILQCWTVWQDKKPIRSLEQPEVAATSDQDPYMSWFVVVWDYSDSKIKILEIKNKSIRKPIFSLAEDPEWGNPFFYDIKITRTGKDKETTRYTVLPCKPSDVPADAKAAYASRKLNLDLLLQGKDPFAEEQTVSFPASVARREASRTKARRVMV